VVVDIFFLVRQERDAVYPLETPMAGPFKPTSLDLGRRRTSRRRGTTS
jgi:hypothetical protein